MHRPSRGHGQPQTQPHPAAGVATRARRGEDPLAELARLIGQEDPFKEFDALQPRRAPVNGNGAAAPVKAAARPDPRANGHVNGSTPAYGYGRDAAARPAASTRTTAAHATAPHADERTRQHPAARPPLSQTPQARSNGVAAGYESPQRPPQSRLNGRDIDARYPDRSYRTREEYPAEERRPARPAAPEQPARRTVRYVPEETSRHARTRQPAYDYRDQSAYEDDYDPEYADDAYLPEHADDIYDDVQRPRRGWGFWIVAAIVVASLVAVAFLGVFAYRTIFNTPPRAAVVTKSNAPVKVEPKNTPQNVATPNKPIQDRVGGIPDQTQTLKREEAPVDLTQPNSQQPQYAPESQRPQPQQQQAPVQRNAPAFTPPPSPQQAPQNADQPKRVKTYTIRSDGTATPNTPQNNAPLPLNATPESDTQSLPPQTRPNSAVPNQNRTTVAALSPVAPPVQQQAPAATGNYIVQVASHKTPEEARAAWEQLKSQYGSIFGGRNADIRKVDLGDRGVFYRAMVGPMSRDQANALCQNLKTQGAGCIVQTRN